MTREQSPFIMLDSRRSDRPLTGRFTRRFARRSWAANSAQGTPCRDARFSEGAGVSRITVLNAYEQLFAEGYLDGKGGAGTFVAAELPDNLLKTETIKRSKQKKTDAPLRLSPFAKNCDERCWEYRARTMQNSNRFKMD